MINLNGKPIEIWDSHIHTFPDKIADSTISYLQNIANIPVFTRGTISETLEKMNEWNIDVGVMLNIATNPEKQSKINDTAAEQNNTLNGKLISLGSIHPDSEVALEELERIYALGIPGIKLHPDYQGFFINDPKMFPIYDKCIELDLPIVFHAGWDFISPDVVHATPKASKEVLDRFPGLKVVLAHLGGNRMWNDVEEYIAGQDVYIDTSMCDQYMPIEQMERILKKHNPDKVLFATDCPWAFPPQVIKMILGLDISDEYKEKIFSLNAKRLFNKSNKNI